MTRGTTETDYRNRNGRTVMRKTDRPGADHNQMTYVLRCDGFGYVYGANRSDIFPHAARPMMAARGACQSGIRNAVF